MNWVSLCRSRWKLSPRTTGRTLEPGEPAEDPPKLAKKVWSSTPQRWAEADRGQTTSRRPTPRRTGRLP